MSRKFTRKAISAAVCGAIASGLSPAVAAQERTADDNADEMEVIEVRGIRRSVCRGLLSSVLLHRTIPNTMPMKEPAYWYAAWIEYAVKSTAAMPLAPIPLAA